PKKMLDIVRHLCRGKTEPFMELCRQSPLEVEVIEKFGTQRLTEEQLNGFIALRNGRVVVLE
ncbi:MAG: hypothetical protein K2N20_02155, partial [Helicobacter sp.]|nr:hypothetical protein [Helicobacter sp.]